MIGFCEEFSKEQTWPGPRFAKRQPVYQVRVESQHAVLAERKATMRPVLKHVPLPQFDELVD
jgi:hypothetical protein